MKEKRIFYRELAYVVGIFVLALGTVFMEKADFGMSMVVAPAYLIHRKVLQFLPFFFLRHVRIRVPGIAFGRAVCGDA